MVKAESMPLLRMLHARSAVALAVNSRNVTLPHRALRVLWVETSRDYMNDDPVLFGMKDPTTCLTGANVLMRKAITAVVEIGIDL